MPVMTVRFSKLDSFYRISSYFEGEYMERIASGAFDASMANPAAIRTLFNHGFDPTMGGKSLGVPTRIYEHEGYACADVPLLDAAYVRELLPGIRAGAYGSSFMFDRGEDRWNWEPECSEDNPQGLPECTRITVELYEQGPVTWPANPSADVQCNSSTTRSGTDWYYAQLERSGDKMDKELVRSALTVPRRDTTGKLTMGTRLKVLREMELGR